MLGDGITPPHNEYALEPRRPDQKKKKKRYHQNGQQNSTQKRRINRSKEGDIYRLLQINNLEEKCQTLYVN